MQDKADILRVNFAPSRPVELADFVRSCGALSNEYNAFAAERGLEAGKLYVKEVRKGSIELDLVAVCAGMLVQQVLPIVCNANAIADFLGHLKGVVGWLKGGGAGAKDRPYADRTLENVSAFLDPVAKDKNATVTVNVVTVNGDVNAPLVVGNTDANYVQNVRRLVEEECASPNVRRVEGVMLRWYQSRNSDEPTGDKAIIETVSKKPLRTVFADRKIKALLLSVEENIFRCAWLVDATVESLDGVPKLYRIESIERLKD